MQFSRDRKEKNISKHQEYIEELARETITLDIFDNKLCIAYDGTPVVEVKEDYTPAVIMDKLNEVRESFVSSKMKLYMPKFLDIIFG